MNESYHTKFEKSLAVLVCEWNMVAISRCLVQRLRHRHHLRSVCLCVCVSTDHYKCTCKNTYIRRYSTYMYMFTYIGTVHIHTCLHQQVRYINIHVYVHRYSTYTYMFTYIGRVHIHTSLHSMCVYMYMYMYIYL